MQENNQENEPVRPAEQPTQAPDETPQTKAQQMVRELLTERREMLVEYNRLAGTEPFDHGGGESLQTRQRRLQRFCQLLMDYAATGHFGLYERLGEKGACQAEILALADRLYPGIVATTDRILEFNEKYNCEDHCDIGPDLKNDLSSLGEVLATRIELEDRITAPLCSGCPDCLPA